MNHLSHQMMVFDLLLLGSLSLVFLKLHEQVKGAKCPHEAYFYINSPGLLVSASSPQVHLILHQVLPGSWH